jgi:hypothetical protein
VLLLNFLGERKKIRGERLKGGDRNMKPSKAEELYDAVRQLSASERLRLMENIARDLASGSDPSAERYDWTSLAGAAPGLLDGEDAQSWVSRTRREADEHRLIR